MSTITISVQPPIRSVARIIALFKKTDSIEHIPKTERTSKFTVRKMNAHKSTILEQKKHILKKCGCGIWKKTF